MGNKSSKRGEVIDNTNSASEETNEFRRIDTRAVTFDERVHQAKPFHFQPLRRAMTYDSRKNTRSRSCSVENLMFRRHFNVVPRRDSMSNRISEVHPTRDVVIVVDPMSTGAQVAQEVLKRGYACVAIFSDTLQAIQDLMKGIPDTLMKSFSAVLFHDGSLENSTELTYQAVMELNLNIVAVLPGAETGVMLTDFFSEKLNLSSNGTSGSIARRNKYAMGEKIRSKGLRAVKQCSAKVWSDVVKFIEQDLKPEPFCVIVKPEESAGSDDVFLCKDMEQVKEAYGTIQGKINHLGLENSSTLIQEYLQGTEFVVDTVSRHGQHKVVAVWEYDKRPCNNAPFVYFGVHLRAVQGDVIPKIVDYVLQVLDALEIQHGPGHAEVKFVNGEPCLIEIGSRCHGGSGTFMCMTDRCIGYNQVEAAIDSYLDAEGFEKLLDRPVELKAHSCEVTLVSFQEGTVTSIPGLKEIEAMPSYLRTEMSIEIGQVIHKTIDMFTVPGSIMLLHDDPEQVKKDFDRIRELELDGLFQVEPLAPAAKKQCIAVVDPFSTGAVLAQDISKRGYECICIYSDSLENMEGVANMVPEGIVLNFAATIGYTGATETTAAAILEAVENLNGELLFVLPGAETGVRLTDQLTNHMNLRGNVFETCDARRDKYEMGETLRKSGVRAVMQTKAVEWSTAKAFIEEMNPVPFRVILKPIESAGSDGVTLCYSMEDAEKTFEQLMGKVNGLGQINNAILIQEYLDGPEYVVDTMTRDGKHKVIAVWRYDKGPCNGAAFVYFGVNTEAADGIVNDIIDYHFTVLDALGVRNGPGHGEVKYFNGEPVLVEVGARCHGGEGTWIPLADRSFGYNQVEAFLDCYLEPESYETKYPERPRELKASGCEVKFVSYQTGKLLAVPGLEEIKQMPSFVCATWMVQPGQNIFATVDLFTMPGGATMIHEDSEILQKDLARIRALEHDGLFDIQLQPDLKP